MTDGLSHFPNELVNDFMQRVRDQYKVSVAHAPWSVKSSKRSTKQNQVRKQDEVSITDFIPNEAMKAQTDQIKHQQHLADFNSHTYKPDHLQKTGNKVYSRREAKRAPRGTH